MFLLGLKIQMYNSIFFFQVINGTNVAARTTTGYIGRKGKELEK